MQRLSQLRSAPASRQSARLIAALTKTRATPGSVPRFQGVCGARGASVLRVNPTVLCRDNVRRRASSRSGSASRRLRHRRQPGMSPDPRAWCEACPSTSARRRGWPCARTPWQPFPAIRRLRRHSEALQSDQRRMSPGAARDGRMTCQLGRRPQRHPPASNLWYSRRSPGQVPAGELDTCPKVRCAASVRQTRQHRTAARRFLGCGILSICRGRAERETRCQRRPGSEGTVDEEAYVCFRQRKPIS